MEAHLTSTSASYVQKTITVNLYVTSCYAAQELHKKEEQERKLLRQIYFVNCQQIN